MAKQQPSLTERVVALESAVREHLIESGAIKSDLKWLISATKGRIAAEVSLLVVVVGAVITYLLHR